jgi:hypothetical protein
MSLGDFSRTELLTNSKNDSVFSRLNMRYKKNELFKFKILAFLMKKDFYHYYKELKEKGILLKKVKSK